MQGTWRRTDGGRERGTSSHTHSLTPRETRTTRREEATKEARDRYLRQEVDTIRESRPQEKQGVCVRLIATSTRHTQGGVKAGWLVGGYEEEVVVVEVERPTERDDRVMAKVVRRRRAPRPSLETLPTQPHFLRR